MALPISDSEFLEFRAWFSKTLMDMNSWEDRLNPVATRVPFRSQWDPDGMKYRNDCGPAVLAMLLESQGVPLRIDQIADECGMSTHLTYTSFEHLIASAKRHQVDLVRRRGMTLTDLKLEFNLSHPVILLVHYGSLNSIIQDKSYKAGHWLLGLKFDGEYLVVHDPDWKPPQRQGGQDLRIPIEMFKTAWSSCHLDGNQDCQGLCLKEE